MPTLYELTENAQQLYDLGSSAQDADDHEAKQAINEAFELLQGELNQKLEQCVYTLKEWEIEASAQKAEEERLKKKRKSVERSIFNLKARMLMAMQAADMTKSKGALHTVSLRKTPAKLIIDDPQKVPDAYLVPQPAKPDNKGIKEALKDGEILDFAHLETGESVSIK